MSYPYRSASDFAWSLRDASNVDLAAPSNGR